MKLFICGGGCADQVKDAYKELFAQVKGEGKVLYVPLAMEESMYDSCHEWFFGEIKNIGFTQFDMVRSVGELAAKNFADYCCIFIGGGNTYVLLQKLKDKRVSKKLLDYIKNNGIVFGGSAGAIVFGKDIDCCQIEDGNICGLKDTSGFNLLNGKSILCHYSKESLERNKELPKEQSLQHKIIYLPEEDVVFFDGNQIKTFGNKPYVVFENGNQQIRDFKNLKNEFN